MFNLLIDAYLSIVVLKVTSVIQWVTSRAEKLRLLENLGMNRLLIFLTSLSKRAWYFEQKASLQSESIYDPSLFQLSFEDNLSKDL